MGHYADYHEAADHYARVGEDLCRQAVVLTAWRVEALLGSGPAAAKVTERLVWAAADLDWAGHELVRLASECRWRAGVSDAYQQTVRAWWAKPEDVRGPFPAQPYPWVTRR
jgi:hypothetical protein